VKIGSISTARRLSSAVRPCSAKREEAVAGGGEEDLGERHLSEAAGDLAPHPLAPVLHPGLREVAVQRPRVPVETLSLQEAAGLGQVVDQVVPGTEQQPRLLLRVDQA
jgi:hypothetical protein